jgi:hypothetical protein
VRGNEEIHDVVTYHVTVLMRRPQPTPPPPPLPSSSSPPSSTDAANIGTQTISGPNDDGCRWGPGNVFFFFLFQLTNLFFSSLGYIYDLTDNKQNDDDRGEGGDGDDNQR